MHASLVAKSRSAFPKEAYFEHHRHAFGPNDSDFQTKAGKSSLAETLAMKPGPPQDHRTNHRAAQMSDRFHPAVILGPPFKFQNRQ